MDKVEFCRSLGLESRFQDLQWFDTTGYQSYLSISGSNLVKIELWECTGLMVSIINKQHGLVDSKEFRFSEYLDSKNRADDTNYDTPFHVSLSAHSLEWYIAVPADTTPIVDAIYNYTKLFW